MTTTFSIRPPSLLGVDHDKLATETDKWLQRIYTAHQTTDATAIKGPARGVNFAVNTGSETITGSKTGITTGLSTVDKVIVSIENADTPTNITATGRVTPTDSSTIDVYCWQPTAAGNTTPVASTTPVSVHWWVSGTATS